MNRLFQGWRVPVVRCFLKLSLPAILALGLAAGSTPAHAQDLTNTPFNVYFSGQIAVGDTSQPLVLESATGYGSGWFFGDATAQFQDYLDTTTDPGNLTSGSWIAYQSDGNAILGTYSGQRSLPDANGIATISGTYTVTDGWNVFMGITGDGVFTGTINVLTGEWTISLSGMISDSAEASL